MYLSKLQNIFVSPLSQLWDELPVLNLCLFSIYQSVFVQIVKYICLTIITTVGWIAGA